MTRFASLFLLFFLSLTLIYSLGCVQMSKTQKVEGWIDGLRVKKKKPAAGAMPILERYAMQQNGPRDQGGFFLQKHNEHINLTIEKYH